MERYGARERLFAAALSGLAGYVDAVGFVQSKGFFVSFMSGNSTRLGVGIADSMPDAMAAAGLLTAFVCGVTCGSIVGRTSGNNRVPAVLLMIATLLAAAATVGVFSYSRASLALTAFAMGAVNATLEHNGRIRVGLTYMTGSVVKVGQALADMLTGSGSDCGPPLILLGGFVSGAALGAIIANGFGFAALWLASATAVTLAGVGWRISGSLADSGQER